MFIDLTKIINLVILDANFILVPIQFGVDYLEKIEFTLEGKTKFIIFKQILDELRAKKKRLQQQEKSATFETQFKAGLDYIEKKKSQHTIEFVGDVKSKEETTDDFLFRKIKELEGKHPYIYLATNDRGLRRRVKPYASLILIRQGKKIYII